MMDEDRVTRLEHEVSDIKAALGRLEPLIVRILEGQARMEGRMADMPTSRDFGALEGQIVQLGQRISDINARLPVPIGYTPAKPAAE